MFTPFNDSSLPSSSLEDLNRLAVVDLQLFFVKTALILLVLLATVLKRFYNSRRAQPDDSDSAIESASAAAETGE